MSDQRRPGGYRLGLAVLGGFVLGAATVLLVVWTIGSGDETVGRTAEVPVVTPADPAPSGEAEPGDGVVTEPEALTPPPDLGRRSLLVPVQGVRPDQLADTFDDLRGGDRVHEALDIMAPRGTPVVAVENGRVAKLFESDAGGLTVYQFDPSETYTYYYAHLDRYAPGLAEGQRLERGQLVGYVGATGNANPEGPHLHFAIFQLGPEKKWWEGVPINPYPVLRSAQASAGAAAPAR